jgi:hypothetical protein
VKWILGAGKEIVIDVNQLEARTKYIRSVTGTDVSNWQSIKVNNRQFLCCISNDTIDGVFITAHIKDVYMLSNTMHTIYKSRIIIANTCIFEKFADKNLLFQLNRNNPNLELFFAKQDLSIDTMHIFRQTTTLLNIGRFGFQSSLSERELFMNRRKGFEEALRQSFVRVSPILSTGE